MNESTTHTLPRTNDDSKITDGERREFEAMDRIPAELVRKILDYLPGQELLFALTCKSNLAHANSLRKDGILPMQRRSAYLCSGELTRYMLAHDMISVDGNLMRIAAAHGCLEGIVVLRAMWARSQDPPCLWYEWTCRYAAGHGGHMHVLQWLR